MEFKCRIADVITSVISNAVKLTLEIEARPSDVEKLLNKDLRCVLKQWRNKRSLDANAYCWKLITEIANEIRISKEEVYLQMLKDYGQSEIVSVRSDINPQGYFKYYEELGRGYVQGKEFTHYKIYKGSSEFDTREMSILIDGVIREAEALGIPTITPKEAERLKNTWKYYYE